MALVSAFGCRPTVLKTEKGFLGQGFRGAGIRAVLNVSTRVPPTNQPHLPPALLHWHHPKSNDPEYTSIFPWVRGSPEFERQAYDKATDFRYLMRLDETRAQCGTCRNASVDNPGKAWELANKYLFCDACLVDHPTAFFSSSQRKEKRKKRKCIGHTGYIRLCDHQVITREDVTAAMWSEVLAMADDDDDLGVIVKVCRHPSHAPQLDHVGVRMVTEYPRACLYWAEDDVILVLRWQGHMRAPSTRGGVVCAREIEARLREMRKGAAEHLVPQSAPGVLPEMRSFDPNKCGCLDYGDKYPAGSHWAGMPLWDGAEGCRTDVTHRLFSGRNDKSRMYWMEGNPDPHDARTLLREDFDIWWKPGVTVAGCGYEESCLRFTYVRSITCGPLWQNEWRTVDDEWLQAVDPDSYRLWEDNETKGALWCFDPKCSNYYRYPGRPVVRRSCAANIVDLFSDSQVVRSWRIKGVMYPLDNKLAILAKQGLAGEA
ncbi:hypothetical protein QBC34DRAFT_431950 [Podospora aff. communis PSN243]|uniref:Uncharacterized protein n=1 Tax=Podospora aff. communis PSN243 TaxID=3040156 RepID=A0AAV9G3M0_9PEZI|nr:hypothetical protein QBC34DRAFT_431950 [Podospora aff. communis PSN243]